MWLAYLHNHSKITAKYRTNITQNHEKIKIYGSPTTKELKKPHSSKQVGGTEGQRHGDVELAGHTPTGGGYKMEGYLRSEGSQPHTRLHRPGFQCQEGKSP